MKTELSRTAALMTTLRALCADLPGAEEYVMVHHPAFRVGKKPFAIAGLADTSADPTLTINLGPMMQGELLDDPRFSRSPYIGRHGWVTVVAKSLKKAELERLVVSSWRRVASKKHLKERDGNGIEDS